MLVLNVTGLLCMCIGVRVGDFSRVICVLVLKNDLGFSH